ncbi:protein suex-1-like [Danaus plexippus]|uniref:protein suex-1-like n=1 Tax=Danaus plexippus TaxID=13037 RepID=UPI002AAF4B3A|nr:protein suex-1-like [Danaus plexippus]
MALWSPVMRGSRTRLSYKTMSSGAFDSSSLKLTALASEMVKIVLLIIASLLSLALSAPVEKAEDLASSDKEDLQTAASHFGPYGYGFGGYRYGGYYGYPYYSYYGYPGYGYGGLYGGFPYGYYGHGFWW